jgi:hypothetical protein
MIFKTKAGVNISKLKPVISDKLNEISRICKQVNGENYIMTITSGNDGKHMIGSKHYTNEAIDIRIRDMKFPTITHVRIKKALGPNYDVIKKKTHIHIEYDPK